MGQRPLTFDHLIGKKKPLTKTVPVVLDPELAEAWEAARRSRDVANARVQIKSDPEAAAQLLEAEAELEAMEKQLEEAEGVAWFKFRGIGRAAYEALVDRHPPTGEQRTKAKAQGMDAIAWNPDSFPPALVAACLVEPALSADEVKMLWADENWNQAELAVLLNAAIEVNGTRRTVDLGKGWSRTRSSAAKSATAQSEESPTASS